MVEGVIHTYEDDEVVASSTTTTVSDDSASAKSSASRLSKAAFAGGHKEHDDWNKASRFLLQGGTTHAELAALQVKLVPKELVVAQFEGCWKKSFRWRRVENGVPVGDWEMLLDIGSLGVFPKSVRPVDQQGEFESRKLWDGVTNHMLRKEYGDATRAKVAIEQTQRDTAAERKRTGEECVTILVSSIVLL